MKISISKEIEYLEKHYEVFISSTYEDLKQHRMSALNAILSHKCLPLGMEMFPSNNEEQLTYIKKIIDKCDIYVLIVGGRYGSRSNKGISYTEEEYRYAKQNKKEIVALLLDEKSLEYREIQAQESDDDKTSLRKFRAEARTGRIANKFHNTDSLKYEISLGLMEAKNNLGPESGLVSSKEVLKVISGFESLNEDEKNRYMVAVNSIPAITSNELLWSHLASSNEALKSAMHSMIISGADTKKNFHHSDLLNSLLGFQRFVELITDTPIRISIKQTTLQKGKIKLRTISTTGGNLSAAKSKKQYPIENYKGLTLLHKDLREGGELDCWYNDDVNDAILNDQFGKGSFTDAQFRKNTKDPSLIPYQTTLCLPIYNMDRYDSDQVIIRGFLCIDSPKQGRFDLNTIKPAAQGYCSFLYLFMSISDYYRANPDIAKAISTSMVRKEGITLERLIEQLRLNKPTPPPPS